LEALAARIEGEHRVAAEVAHPRDVALVDVDRVGARRLAGQLPRAPAPVGGIVHRQVAAVPFADPDAAAAVAPDAARALVLRRRLDDARFAGGAIELRDERSGERAPPDLAAGRRADAVGAAPVGRTPHARLPRLRIEATDEAALAGEPEDSVRVEGGSVEIGVGRAVGQRKDAHVTVGPADANDRVLPAGGEPGGAGGTPEHA